MQATLFKDSVDILAPSGTADGYGNESITWTVLASGVPARQRILGGGLTKTNEQTQEIEYNNRFFFGPDATLSDEYRIQLNDELFEIVFVVPAYGRTELDHYRVDAKKL